MSVTARNHAGARIVLLASPQSICAGVERAITVVEQLLDHQDGPIYVRKQIVHNTHVVAELHVADPARVSYLTPTTLAVDETIEIVEALRTRFPALRGPASDDICYATTNPALHGAAIEEALQPTKDLREATS